MRIREARPGEAAAVRGVVDRAFGEEPVGALWDDVRAAGWVRRELVAVDGDPAAGAGEVVVGHVGLSHAWLDARRALVDVLVLSPLSTAPERQGEGIGTALVRAAVEAAREVGAPALFLEGDPGYYGARGFVAAASLGCEPASARTPGPAFQVVPLEDHEEWMAGRLVYPDVWWRHDAVGLRDPDLARVEERLRDH